MFPRIYKSEALAVVHEMIEGLHVEGGAIEKRTLREFDDACLAPATALQPEQIKAIREAEHISQPVFARYLNVSKNLVSDRERGNKRPGAAVAVDHSTQGVKCGRLGRFVARSGQSAIEPSRRLAALRSSRAGAAPSLEGADRLLIGRKCS